MNLESVSARRSLVALSLFIVLGITLPCHDAAAQGKAKQPTAEQRARANLRRLPESKSLLWDFSTLRAFSYLKKADVLPTLIKIYRKPPTTPKDHIRYMTATVIRQKYDSQRFLGSRYYRRQKPTDSEFDLLIEFAKKNCSKEIQGWGAFNASYVLAQYDKVDKRILALAMKDKNVIRRAAVIEALGHTHNKNLLPLAETLIPKVAKIGNKYQKAILMESLTWAVSRYASRWYRPKPVPKKPVKKTPTPKANPPKKATPAGTPKKAPVTPPKRVPPAKPLVKPPVKVVKKPSPEEIADKARATAMLMLVIDQVDNKRLLERTRRDISLALQYCFGTKFAYEDPESWKGELLKKKSEFKKPETTHVRFMGIEDRGKRIIFLLDGSDSMLNPLTQQEIDSLKGLLPKPSSKKSVTRGKKRPWEDIKNRFDAARLHLQHTLLNMSSEVTYAVVLFGNQAELLSTTPGFVKANKRSAGMVMKTLWDIKPGPTSTARPHGTLKGQTNIYQAFDLAFKVGKRGLKKTPAAYVDKKLYLEGVETIYLLSDGKPTRDGFTGQTPKMKTGGYWVEPYEGEVTDPETGIKRKVSRKKRIFVPERERQYTHGIGPYVQYDPLINELARMNMLRRVVIHVIAIGEVDRVLPRRIAEIGRGRWIHVADR
jgi:hypothetical protein